MEHIGRSLDQAVARFAAAVDSGDTSVAAVSLGRQRGEHGVGIGHSLEDLEAVHRIVTGQDPSPAVIRAFADAWAEAAVGQLLVRGALDHRTGLATSDYLTTRLRDLVRCGEARHRMLVLVDRPAAVPTRFALLLRSARVAAELLASFPGAETPADLSDARIVAIVPREVASEPNLMRARVAIGVIDGAALARVRMIELPAEAEAVGTLVRGL